MDRANKVSSPSCMRPLAHSYMEPLASRHQNGHYVSNGHRKQSIVAQVLATEGLEPQKGSARFLIESKNGMDFAPKFDNQDM